VKYTDACKSTDSLIRIDSGDENNQTYVALLKKELQQLLQPASKSKRPSAQELSKLLYKSAAAFLCEKEVRFKAV
jgi:hypothetical protein